MLATKVPSFYSDGTLYDENKEDVLDNKTVRYMYIYIYRDR